MFKSFWKDTRGNYAMLLGIMALPMIGAGGLAVDYGMASRKKSHLQEVLDLAALAGASSDASGKAEIGKVVEEFFKTNLHPNLVEITKLDISFSDSDSRIDLSASTDHHPLLMSVFQAMPISINVSASAIKPGAKAIELALVLDATWSMNGRKMDDLKRAALQLVTQFEAMSSNKDIKIGIVPFSNYVRINPQTTPWKEWLLTQTGTDVKEIECKWFLPKGNKCTPVYGMELDGTAIDSWISHYECDKGGQAYWGCEASKTKLAVWEGCIGSRSNNLELSAAPAVAAKDKYIGVTNVNCWGSYVQPLTRDWASLKKTIRELEPNNDTYIPTGILWGWNMLRPGMPLAEASDWDEGATKVMILMTDGANMTYTEPGVFKTTPFQKHMQIGDMYWPAEQQRQKEANRKQMELCKSVKADGIEIYTVSVEVDQSVADLVRGCASRPNMAFDVKNSVTLANVFSNIGKSISAIRLVR